MCFSVRSLCSIIRSDQCRLCLILFHKRKRKEEYLYSAILVCMHTLKALRHGSHTFTCKQHHACLSFVSVHQMAPPQLRQQTSNCSFTTHYRLRRDERLSWPGWLTYSGWLTHISGHPSVTGRAQNSADMSAASVVVAPKTDVLPLSYTTNQVTNSHASVQSVIWWCCLCNDNCSRPVKYLFL